MSSLPNQEHFTIWVLQEQQAVMTFLGKLVNPITGEMERSLEAARWHIDLLGAIAERTRGNLAPEEERLLTQILTNLRLNFVQEAARPETAEGEAGVAKAEAAEPSAEAAEPEAEPAEPEAEVATPKAEAESGASAESKEAQS